MLAYVFFFSRLQDMPTEDLSHLEMYIKKMVRLWQLFYLFLIVLTFLVTFGPNTALVKHLG